MSDGQTSLLDLWRCDACDGAGKRPDPETGGWRRCGVCEGTGQLDYDPELAVQELGF